MARTQWVALGNGVLIIYTDILDGDVATKVGSCDVEAEPFFNARHGSQKTREMPNNVFWCPRDCDPKSNSKMQQNAN